MFLGVKHSKHLGLSFLLFPVLVTQSVTTPSYALALGAFLLPR